MKPLVAAAFATALLSNAADSLLAHPSDAGAGRANARSSACSNCGVVASIRRMKLNADARWVDAAAAASRTDTARNPKASPAPNAASRPKPPAPSALSGTGDANQAARDGEIGPRRSTVYEVVIRMEDGQSRKMHYEHRPALNVGDRVRVSRGQVYLR